MNSELLCFHPSRPLFQVVSEECSEEIQCCCLSLLHLATEHSITAYLEFQQHGGMALIQQVLRTPQAAVGELTLKVCMGKGASIIVYLLFSGPKTSANRPFSVKLYPTIIKVSVSHGYFYLLH